MKLRRPEFRRARKIRQRARKRRPLMRSLKTIFADAMVAMLSITDGMLDDFKDPSIDKDTYIGGGRYIGTAHYFD